MHGAGSSSGSVLSSQALVISPFRHYFDFLSSIYSRYPERDQQCKGGEEPKANNFTTANNICIILTIYPQISREQVYLIRLVYICTEQAIVLADRDCAAFFNRIIEKCVLLKIHLFLYKIFGKVKTNKIQLNL